MLFSSFSLTICSFPSLHVSSALRDLPPRWSWLLPFLLARVTRRRKVFIQKISFFRPLIGVFAVVRIISLIFPVPIGTMFGQAGRGGIAPDLVFRAAPRPNHDDDAKRSRGFHGRSLLPSPFFPPYALKPLAKFSSACSSWRRFFAPPPKGAGLFSLAQSFSFRLHVQPPETWTPALPTFQAIRFRRFENSPPHAGNRKYERFSVIPPLHVIFPFSGPPPSVHLDCS